MRRKFTIGLTASLALIACSDDTIEPGELVHVSTGSHSFPVFDRTLKVDILVVIDNSSSMAEEQAILANNFGAFIQVLESDDVRADYRIAITTTDNGNPACDPQLTTPEFGELVMSSCKQRLDEFVLDQDPDNVVDARDVACNDICTLDAAALERLPTTTTVDHEPAPRPWLERIGGRSNLPAGTSMAEALRCFGPQGISGCGFESPLESMYRALIRSQDQDDPSYGFMRHDATLMVLFVTDEVDCSYAESAAVIFEKDGADAPSSAVCWNAGVSCEGDPSHYSSCDPANKDLEGNEQVDDADALMRPMSRYIGLLDGLEQQQRAFNPNAQIIVGLIGGVSPSDGTPFYAEIGDADPEFQDRFGIGPGCVGGTPSQSVRAVPPVRLRALVDTFTPGNMFSICAQDYSPALESVAFGHGHGPQIAPACFEYCAEDTDPATPALEPSCFVESRPLEGGEDQRVQECRHDATGYLVQDGDFVMPADDVDVCFAMLTDTNMATPSTADDMSDYCVDSDRNLEFRVARRPGFPGVASSFTATCTLAESPAINCPGLGD